MRVWIAVLVAGAACGRLQFGAEPDARGAGQDARLDGSATGDGGLGAFGAPVPIPGVSAVGAIDQDCTMRGDMLELYFSSTRGGSTNHVYVATRSDLASPWSTPVAVSALNSSATDWDTTPEITPDGLALWVTSTRQPGPGVDVFASTRPDLATAWSTPAYDSTLSGPSGTYTYGPQPSPDKLTIVFGSDRAVAGDYDLYISTRASATSPWGAPVAISELNTPSQESDPFLTADGLTLYYTSNAAGTDDLLVATRTAVGQPFGAPLPVTELNSTANEQDIWLSPDGHDVIFASDRNGGDWDLYQASR